jgi:phosphoglycolate phosphatase-like HAD superfamily hydrolase
MSCRLSGTSIEILNDSPSRGQFRSVLFDFDGTLSLIRAGWQDVMIPMMVEVLAELGTDEPEAELTAHVREFVDRLTGKQTIYQMIQLAEEVRRRGGTPPHPLEYKHRYHDRLMERIRHRREGLAAGSLSPEALMLPRSRDLLEALRCRGLDLYLASGTDEKYVVEEAELLQVTRYFNGGVYGAQEDYRRFSKAKVIQSILTTRGLGGAELLSFGDGYVEVENTKEVGGFAVGVASDEARCGGMDEWKRSRLTAAGADLLIPDYRELEALLGYLFPEGGVRA